VIPVVCQVLSFMCGHILQQFVQRAINDVLHWDAKCRLDPALCNGLARNHLSL